MQRLSWICVSHQHTLMHVQELQNFVIPMLFHLKKIKLNQINFTRHWHATSEPLWQFSKQNKTNSQNVWCSSNNNNNNGGNNTLIVYERHSTCSAMCHHLRKFCQFVQCWKLFLWKKSRKNWFFFSSFQKIGSKFYLK